MKKIIILTGGSKGIGRAAAITLGRSHTVILISRNKDGLEESVRLVKESGGEAEYHVCDITDEEAVRVTIESVLAKYGKIDVLVNNAGVGIFKRVDKFTAAEFDLMYRVNMLGVFFCCKYTVPGMIKNRRGQIINISSVAGLNGFSGGSAYASSKFALMGFTESIREDLKKYGIAVSAICPGGVNTSFGDKDVQKMIKRKDYLLEPEDVAHSIEYLVNESETANTKLIELKPRCREDCREVD